MSTRDDAIGLANAVLAKLNNAPKCERKCCLVIISAGHSPNVQLVFDLVRRSPARGMHEDKGNLVVIWGSELFDGWIARVITYTQSQNIDVELGDGSHCYLAAPAHIKAEIPLLYKNTWRPKSPRTEAREELSRLVYNSNQLGIPVVVPRSLAIRSEHLDDIICSNGTTIDESC